MEQRMSLITLGVADLQRAVAFYENVVGWKAQARALCSHFGRMTNSPRTSA